VLIKYKLILNTGVFLLSLVLIFFAFDISGKNIEKLNAAKTLAYEQNVNMLSLRRHEKDFLARRTLSYQEKYEKTFTLLQSNQARLKQTMENQNLPTDTLDSLTALFKSYRLSFNDIVAANVELGLTSKEGLTGMLRAAVHQIEEELSAKNKNVLLVIMLQLRRAEKDFMLRSDIKYIKKFQSLIGELQSAINAENFDSSSKATLLQLTEEYQNGFYNYTLEAQRIGLSSSEGLLRIMRKKIQASEGGLKTLVETLDIATNNRIENSFYLTIGIFFVIACISLVFTLLVNRSIVLPLSWIQGAMGEIHKTRDIKKRIDSETNDEINQVAQSINMMLADFQAALEVVWNAANHVNDTSSKLTRSSYKTTYNLEQQRKETEMVASSMIEMVSSVDEVSSNMEHVTQMTLSTQNDAKEGKLKVDSAIKGIVRLSDRLDGSVATAGELAKESESIGSVLSVIQGIAEQTNLLALNAAIEAARAGEQGRGFAVVADEVRALASRTHSATVEIAEIIESLQKRTQGIVKLVGECREDGLASRKDAEMIKELLDTIIKEVVDIADMSSRVSVSLEEQTSATDQVNNTIEKIRVLTEDTTKAMEVSFQSSKDISSQTESLYTAVSVFKVG